MKQQCRDTLERVTGIIEGLAWVLEDKGAKEALNCAANMLLGVLEAEEGADNEQRAD